jgi:hypothetical protein
MEYEKNEHLKISRIVDAEILNECDTDNPIFSCDYGGTWYGIILYNESSDMWVFSPNGEQCLHKIFVDDISKFLERLHFENKGKLN